MLAFHVINLLIGCCDVLFDQLAHLSHGVLVAFEVLQQGERVTLQFHQVFVRYDFVLLIAVDDEPSVCEIHV